LERVNLAILLIPLLAWSASQVPPRPTVGSGELIHGMTISTQTSGREWGSDGFEAELDRLQALGINWVAIHPYAGLRGDGTVSVRHFDHAAPPTWLTRPIAAAHARGMHILIKPHLAYWGSPFEWRGAIVFLDPEDDARFWAGFCQWTLDLAAASKDADAFCVGTELELQTSREAEWRALIAGVRARTKAHLSYAANWDGVERVPFWDALDAIGVQAYFPLLAPVGPGGIPAAQDMREAWAPHLARLKALSESTGKPVFFAELGYDRTEAANLRPWEGAPRRTDPTAAAAALQLRCLQVAFEVLDEESAWLRGAFLWKWFVGASGREDFRLDLPATRELLSGTWGAAQEK